jgi:Protein of unknown function (DUF3501)
MEALKRDDLLPLDEFAGRRTELFARHARYLDRYRRVRIGPRLTLVFENRQTLWFRAQDLLRITRVSDPAWVQRELDLLNRLLPGRDRLQAGLLLDIADETRLTEELAPWRDLTGDHLRLHVGPIHVPANLLTCRPEDRAIGTAHWVQFVLDPAARQCLADFRRPAHFTVHLPTYPHDSGPLSDEVRESLLEDLALSDRDGAKAS